MSLAARAEAKDSTFVRVFAEVPDLLIQDPAHECAYLVPAFAVEDHSVSDSTWNDVDEGTVTFLIPDGNLFAEVPPFSQEQHEEPSVLVQFPRGSAAYFFSFAELQMYRIDQPTEYPDGFNGISFVIPRGTALIERLPATRRATLQSGT